MIQLFSAEEYRHFGCIMIGIIVGIIACGLVLYGYEAFVEYRERKRAEEAERRAARRRARMTYIVSADEFNTVARHALAAENLRECIIDAPEGRTEFIKEDNI